MKLGEYEFRQVPGEVIDFKNDTITLLNYGKYQPQVLTSVPNWKGNRGEFCWVVSTTTAALYAYMATAGTTWSRVVGFTI
jgi:hypothetical protein